MTHIEIRSTFKLNILYLLAVSRVGPLVNWNASTLYLTCRGARWFRGVRECSQISLTRTSNKSINTSTSQLLK